MAEVERVTELEEMNQLLGQATVLLRQAVDVAARARSQGAEARGTVDREWENFLGGFLGYLKQKGRESGQNLLAGISFARILSWTK